MDATTTKPWDDGLTPEQAAMVEKAARAAWESDSGFFWADLRESSRHSRCREMAAALRAIGHLPTPKKPTRGEVVAEMVVTLDGVASDRFHFHSAPDGITGQVIITKPSRVNLGWVREYIAGWIDAERQSARDEALEEAANLFSDEVYESTTAKQMSEPIIRWIGNAIRRLKSDGGAK